MPSRVLDWSCPYSILFDEEPDYSQIKPFGCLAYATNIHPSKGKFDPRSHKCVLLGFDSSHKGFLLFDLENDKLLISRDVKYVPNKFPFLDSPISVPEPSIPFPAVTTEPDNDDVPSSSHTPEVPLPSPHSAPSTLESQPSLEIQDCPPQRRSTRFRQVPRWMNDYVSHIAVSQHISLSTSITPPTFPYTINPLLGKSHISYLFNLSMVREPSSYKEACQYPGWIDAMNSKLEALIQNQTWEITDLPSHKKPIGCKWVYKVKLNSDGSVERCKARLVAKGYTQEFGIDYQELFSPVANPVTVRVFIALATAYSWSIHQLDIHK